MLSFQRGRLAVSAAAHAASSHPQSALGAAHASQRMTLGPYRVVGNVIVVRCIDHPFKHFWEVNKELRDLRLEFKGQTVVVPDTPAVRTKLWRVRHVVKLDMLDLDEVRQLVGVPTHIKFQELRQQIPLNFGRGRGRRSPFARSRVAFHSLRSQRLRDILERDAVEKRLLAKRKALRAGQQQQKPLEPAGSVSYGAD